MMKNIDQLIHYNLKCYKKKLLHQINKYTRMFMDEFFRVKFIYGLFFVGVGTLCMHSAYPWISMTTWHTSTHG